jgi:L-rhamnonate dehydratase
VHQPMHSHAITRISWARLDGRRPRCAGCNARLGEHGTSVSPPIARITTEDGAHGFGWASISSLEARQLLGLPLATAFGMTPETFEALLHTPGGLAGGVMPAYRNLEYPLLDLAGSLAGMPVYALVAENAPAQKLAVPCYDTSIYIDDLAQTDEAAAADIIAAEAAEGWAAGHRAFKVKVGRGARHMPLMEGLRRDIAVIHAVRDAIGPNTRLMIDANNGYNLNIAKTVLQETAELRVYWLEEPFHEDAELYRALKHWMADARIPTLIADGEGDASPRLLDWARDGLLDVVQYDIHHPGFSHWLQLGRTLDSWGVRSAPHSYGDPFGNYASCHLAPAIQGFEMVEWDEAVVDGLDASGYRVIDGMARVPASPGFGLALDLVVYERRALEQGFVVM